MKRLIYHAGIPSLMIVAFFAMATTPVELLGCRTRGLAALGIALASGLAACVAAIIGTIRKTRGDRESYWWVISTLVLVVPLVALLIMA